MILDVHYYGMVAEITACSQEGVEMEDHTTVDELNQLLQKKYPSLSRISYKIAIDQRIARMETPLMDRSKVVLLPPFAGG